MNKKEIELLKDRFKTMSLKSVEILLDQYKWEESNGLENHTEKIVILEEVYRRKSILEYFIEQQKRHEVII